MSIMFESLKTILIGSDNARRAAFKIGEFDYLCGLPFSVKGFVNSNATEHFTLVNSGWDWYDLPIYHDLQTAIDKQEVDSVGIYVNAKYVLEWVRQAVKFDQVKNVVILAEDVPERDAREIVFLADKYKINIIGPSSTGILVAGKGRLGEIGGDFRNLQKSQLDEPGPTGLITKSGGMSGELMWVISQNSPGLSTAVQIGGDAFPATDFVWWLEKFADDSQTKIVVLAGEAGGDLEERAAEWYKNYLEDETKEVSSGIKERKIGNGRGRAGKFKLVAVVSGKFLEQMPKGQKFGHAGAKQEESGFGSVKNKIEALRKAGVEVVEFKELGKRLQELSRNLYER